MIGLRSFFPAGGNSTLHTGVVFLDIVDRIGIQKITAGGLGIETEFLMELSEHIVDDLFLGLFIEHPNAEVLCMVFCPEFGTGQPQ